MSPEDNDELHRLGDMLRTIDEGLLPTSVLREALQKAGLALQLGFINGLRNDIEARYEGIGAPLTETQRQHLRSMGIEP